MMQPPPGMRIMATFVDPTNEPGMPGVDPGKLHGRCCSGIRDSSRFTYFDRCWVRTTALTSEPTRGQRNGSRSKVCALRVPPASRPLTMHSALIQSLDFAAAHLFISPNAAWISRAGCESELEN